MKRYLWIILTLVILVGWRVTARSRLPALSCSCEGEHVHIIADDDAERIELRAADTSAGTVEINASHAAMNGANGTIVADSGGIRLIAGGKGAEVDAGTGEFRQSVGDTLSGTLESEQMKVVVDGSNLKFRVRLANGNYATASVTLIVDP